MVERKVDFGNFEWVDIEGPDRKSVSKISDEYGIDYYLILDSLQRGHLPKIANGNGYTFLILRAFSDSYSEKAKTVEDLSDKIAFFFDADRIITIHRSSFDFIGSISEEMKFADQESLLMYFMVKMIGSYSRSANDLSEKIDSVESIIFLDDYRKVSLENLYYKKSQARLSKKILMMTQDVIDELDISESNMMEFNDIKDQILSLVLAFDEVVDDSSNLVNTHMSISSQKTNEVMKLLTIFSAFFLPLTFIAGLYGMNFKFMPELDWRYSYPFVWALMCVISGMIYYWFKKKDII
jgi:magnesium transporter